MLTTGGNIAIGATTSFNLRKGPLMGCRYETTAAASSPPPPAEKYEYQAEVNLCQKLYLSNCSI